MVVVHLGDVPLLKANAVQIGETTERLESFALLLHNHAAGDSIHKCTRSRAPKSSEKIVQCGRSCEKGFGCDRDTEVAFAADFDRLAEPAVFGARLLLVTYIASSSKARDWIGRNAGGNYLSLGDRNIVALSCQLDVICSNSANELIQSQL